MAKKKSNIPVPIVMVPLIVFVMVIFSLLFFRSLYPGLGLAESRPLSLNNNQPLIVSDNQEQILPEIFPQNFPLPKEANLESVNVDKSENIEAVSAVWKTNVGFNQVADFYNQELAKTDWEEESQFNKQNSKIFTIKNQEFDGFVAITSSDGGDTIISVSLSKALN